MMQRRTVLAALGGMALLGAGGIGLRAMAAREYAKTATASRTPLNLQAKGAERLAEIMRFACLAPNSHNTQAWRFTPTTNGVVLQVDPDRRTPVVDPDDHHLFVSLGAAAETLVIAATAYGIVATPTIAPDGVVALTFGDSAEPSPLIASIPARQSNRGIYAAGGLTADERAALQAVDAPMRLISDATTLTALRALSAVAYGAQMEDAAYRAELLHWLRFSEVRAIQVQDGLFSGCSGGPSLPDWLGRAAFPLIVTRQSQVAALQAQMASADTLALFVCEADTPAGRIDTGRRLVRVTLAATKVGLAHAYINPGLENPASRAEAARICGLTSGRPSVLLRFGRAGPMPFSLRRPPSLFSQS